MKKSLALTVGAVVLVSAISGVVWNENKKISARELALQQMTVAYNHRLFGRVIYHARTYFELNPLWSSKEQEQTALELYESALTRWIVRNFGTEGVYTSKLIEEYQKVASRMRN